MCFIFLESSAAPVQADFKAEISASKEVDIYTQYLPSLEGMDELVSSECSCQYLLAPSLKTIKQGLLVRAQYYFPCSNQHYETIIIFAPRNFRYGEGLNLFNLNYQTNQPSIGLGDWSTIIQLEFINPGWLFTKNNVWVFVRGWISESEIDSEFPKDNLTQIAERISQIIPDNFIELIPPDVNGYISLGVSEDSNVNSGNLNLQDRYFFYPEQTIDGQQLEKISLDNAAMVFTTEGMWKTYDELIVTVNGVKGSLHVELPDEFSDDLLIIHTHEGSYGEQFIQSWEYQADNNWIESAGTLFPEPSTTVLRYLDHEQKIFYQIFSGASPHHLYIISNGRILVNNSFEIHHTSGN